MNDKEIYFFEEDINYRVTGKIKIRNIIRAIISDQGKIAGTINIIICSDEYLLNCNRKFLKHNYLTDVIAFDFAFRKKVVTGDIFISIERVKENAKKYHEKIYNELNRVIFHGVLHLTGMTDKTQKKRLEMRQTENHYLSAIESGRRIGEK